MKKLLVFVLVFALCCSMSGCATSENSVENKEKDKSEPIAEESGKFINTDAYADYMDIAIGEWEYFAQNTGVTAPVENMSKLVLNEDGTGEYGDRKFTWHISNIRWSEWEFDVDCYENETDNKYCIIFRKYSDEKIWRCEIASVERIDDSTIRLVHEDENASFKRVNTGALETVKLTPENFFDYFEISEKEFKGLYDEYNHGMVTANMKPEFAERIVATSFVDVEFTYKLVSYKVAYDETKDQLFILGPRVEVEPKIETCKDGGYISYDGIMNNDGVGFWITEGYTPIERNDDEDGYWIFNDYERPEDIQVSSCSGELYLTK